MKKKQHQRLVPKSHLVDRLATAKRQAEIDASKPNRTRGDSDSIMFITRGDTRVQAEYDKWYDIYRKGDTNDTN